MLYIMRLRSISGLLLIFIIAILQVVSACVSEANGALIVQHTNTMTPLVSAMMLPKITVSVTLIISDKHSNMFWLKKTGSRCFHYNEKCLSYAYQSGELYPYQNGNI